jgi:hypothetical protein
LANTLMANGTPALTVINLLGHATTGTAPKSYIQVYPCLQCEQLSAWLESQGVIRFRPSLSLADFGAAQGISREGAYKLARECLEARRDLRRSSSLAFADLVSILRYRIRKAQNQQLTSAHLSRAERPGVPVD